ncbi:unnamed protein product [Miscanthus lutarioriparius]|uniref:Pentatricopeptide repeat-containing protein n=1 Tax=Miscanthus lutarioriparius TaxID=422564 RepID=A0A811SI57_9POAL|nr:unnamed protein product [Miscanthus lutarioriparius]
MGDVRPNEHVYASVARSCAALQALAAGAQVHAHAVKSGFLGASFVANSVVSMYTKCGCYEAGFSYAAALVICSNLENSGIAAALHCDTVKIGLDVTAFVGNVILGIALAACGELSLFRHGSEVHGHLIRSRDDADVAASNAIMSMYASKQGHATEVINAFDRMKETGMAPDSITFTGLLAACNHAGLVSQGMEYFYSMGQTHGVSRRAEGHVQASAFRDDPVVLGSLLSACRVHGDTDVGGRVAERLLALGPATSSPYLLLSHLYASGGRWDGVAEAWRMLEDGAAKKKDAGCSAVGFR